MGLFTALRLSRAARRYGQELPPCLARSYGSSEYYTPPQIREAARALGLDPRFIAIGYAAFLPKEQFDAVEAEMPISLSYAEARAAFERHAPWPYRSASGQPNISWNIFGRAEF
jgi:hypothetical protein